jgi:phosphatidylinositol glycan class N
MNNIQVVDNIVQQTETLFSEFYDDEDTSYIFTADHGMSDIGNHGDGGNDGSVKFSISSLTSPTDPDNTRTPLLAWGRGIRGPLPDSKPSSHDEYSSSWKLGHLLRRDVEQADVASLMAALIGIAWPVNSVGVLPDVDPTRPGYLLPRKGEETLAQAAFVNAKVKKFEILRVIY